jgi:hypothetical protein
MMMMMMMMFMDVWMMMFKKILETKIWKNEDT